MSEVVAKKRKQLLTDTQLETVAEAIKQMDFQWWLSRAKKAEVRQDLIKLTGIKITHENVSLAVEGYCEWYKVVRRVRPSKATLLTELEWTELRKAVSHFRPILLDKPIDVAVAVVSTMCPTNKWQLEGLASGLRCWV